MAQDAMAFFGQEADSADPMAQRGLTARLVGSLHVEAMLLADEARAYFDDEGRAERDALPPLQRVAFSCEALKVTTRLMHVIAWLLTRRAVEAGELSPAQARSPSRRLGEAAESDAESVALLPARARLLIEESRDLYRRLERLDRDLESPPAPPPSPARRLQGLLERAF